MAENRVIERAVSGFWPWATAMLVITPAPRAATANWVTSSPRGLGEGVTGQHQSGAATLGILHRINSGKPPGCYLGCWNFKGVYNGCSDAKSPEDLRFAASPVSELGLRWQPEPGATDSRWPVPGPAARRRIGTGAQPAHAAKALITRRASPLQAAGAAAGFGLQTGCHGP